MTRSRSFTGSVTAAVLVVGFGNQWVSDWIQKNFDSDNVLGWFMNMLTAPSWSLHFSGSDKALRAVVAQDVLALLTIGLVYALLVAFRKTFPEGFSGFILGWSTLIFASALAGLASAAILPPGIATVSALNTATAAATYGLVTGWTVGFITSVGRNIPWVGKTVERPREGAAA